MSVILGSVTCDYSIIWQSGFYKSSFERHVLISASGHFHRHMRCAVILWLPIVIHCLPTFCCHPSFLLNSPSLTFLSFSVCRSCASVPSWGKDDTGDKGDILFTDIILGELVALSFVGTDNNLHCFSRTCLILIKKVVKFWKWHSRILSVTSQDFLVPVSV